MPFHHQHPQIPDDSGYFIGAAMDALSAHLAILDEQGTIIAVNTAWRTFAQSNNYPDPLYGVGTNYLEVCGASDELADDLSGCAAGGIRAVLAGEQDTFSLEYPCHSATEERWFILRVSRFEYDNRRWGVIAHENITTRKQAEHEAIQSNQRLRAANAELDSFVHTVSHDLKSPLVTMFGFADCLKSGLNEQQTELQDDVTRILRAIKRMQTNINHLLDLSRAGRIVDQLQPVAIKQIAQELFEDHAQQIRTAGIQIRIDADIPTVDADPVRIRQVLDNLLTNALKYGCDTPDPTVEIGAQTADGEVWFYVKDNGKGIVSKHQDKVFTLFSRLETSIEGSGVGLAIVKRVIEGHGGRVWVESEPDRGATFWFSLPSASQAAYRLTSNDRRINEASG